MTASNSEIRVLVAAIRKNGFKVARTGNGAHQKVLRPNGSQVADADGPLILSGSPSDHRWRDMHVNRLMKAGVLKEDPWNPKKTTGDESGDGKSKQKKAEEAAKERRESSLRDRSELFRRRTQDVRASIEPIIAKLGGSTKCGCARSAYEEGTVADRGSSPRASIHYQPRRKKEVVMAGTTGLLEIIPESGGREKTRYAWNGDPADRAAARAAFEEVVARGGVLAMVVDAPGKATQVRSFDEIEAVERERGTVTAQVSRQIVGG